MVLSEGHKKTLKPSRAIIHTQDTVSFSLFLNVNINALNLLLSMFH